MYFSKHYLIPISWLDGSFTILLFFSSDSYAPKGSIHVLQRVIGLLLAHLEPQALSLNTEMVWGDIFNTILKDKEMLKNLRRMTDLLLSLSNITKAVYSGFHEG